MDFIHESRAHSITNGGTSIRSCSFSATSAGEGEGEGGGGAAVRGRGRATGVMRDFYTNGVSYGGASSNTTATTTSTTTTTTTTTTTSTTSSSSDLVIHTKTQECLEGAHHEDSIHQQNAHYHHHLHDPHSQSHDNHEDNELISANTMYLDCNTNNQNESQNNNFYANDSTNASSGVGGGGLGFPCLKSSPVPIHHYLPGGFGWQYSQNQLLNPSLNYSATTGSFTSEQWLEFTQQTYIFKHFTAGVPPPPALLLPIINTLALASMMQSHTSSSPASLNLFGGLLGGFNLGLMRPPGNHVDPEPGRCRRTDGKKWRCARDAMPDQKYCERHMHRGRHRARAAAKQLLTNHGTAPAASASPSPSPSPNPSADPIACPNADGATANTHRSQPPQPLAICQAPITIADSTESADDGHLVVPIPPNNNNNNINNITHTHSNPAFQGGVNPQLEQLVSLQPTDGASTSGSSYHVPVTSEHQRLKLSSPSPSSRTQSQFQLALQGREGGEALEQRGEGSEINKGRGDPCIGYLVNAPDMGIMKGNLGTRPQDLAEMLGSTSPNTDISSHIPNIDFISSFPPFMTTTNINPYNHAVTPTTSTTANLEENLAPWLDHHHHHHHHQASEGNKRSLSYGPYPTSSSGLSIRLQSPLSLSMAKFGDGDGDDEEEVVEDGMGVDTNININNNHHHYQHHGNPCCRNPNDTDGDVHMKPLSIGVGTRAGRDNWWQISSAGSAAVTKLDDNDMVGGPLAEVLQSNSQILLYSNNTQNMQNKHTIYNHINSMMIPTSTITNIDHNNGNNDSNRINANSDTDTEINGGKLSSSTTAKSGYDSNNNNIQNCSNNAHNSGSDNNSPPSSTTTSLASPSPRGVLQVMKPYSNNCSSFGCYSDSTSSSAISSPLRF